MGRTEQQAKNFNLYSTGKLQNQTAITYSWRIGFDSDDFRLGRHRSQPEFAAELPRLY